MKNCKTKLKNEDTYFCKFHKEKFCHNCLMSLNKCVCFVFCKKCNKKVSGYIWSKETGNICFNCEEKINDIHLN